MKDKKIIQAIQNVHYRERMQALFNVMASGLLLAGIMAAILVIVCVVADMKIASLASFLGMTILVGLVAGAVTWVLGPMEFLETARKIDSHYKLKDRMLTAYRLLEKDTVTPIERLQIDDTAKHAENIDPREVTRFRVPKDLPRAAGAFVVLVILCLLSPIVQTPQIVSAAVTQETLVEMTDQLRRELLTPIEEMVRENPDDETMIELNAKVSQLIEQLEQLTADPKQSLATLTQMEQSINQAIAEFNLEAVDASLRDIADALACSETTRNAADAIREGDYLKAADEMEKADIANMSNKDRQNVSGQLKKAVDSIERRKQDQLARITAELAEQLEKGDCAGCQKSLCELGKSCCKQCSRKDMCQKMQCQLAKLGQCKGDCANCAKSCAGAQAAGTGGNGDEPGTEKGDELFADDATSLNGERSLTEITGIISTDGASEFETFRSNEGTGETGTQEYRDAFREHQKAVEAVLDSEPLPVEQRQVIQRYFESIRPTDGDLSQMDE